MLRNGWLTRQSTWETMWTDVGIFLWASNVILVSLSPFSPILRFVPVASTSPSPTESSAGISDRSAIRLVSSTIPDPIILVSRTVSYNRVDYLSLVSPALGFVCCAVTASSSVTTSTSAARSMGHNEPVVSAEWLHANLGDPDVKVLDASWYLPNEKRNPLQEYQVAHIPSTLFFDIDGITDQTSDLPHTLPTEEAFAAAVSALGIHNKDSIVVYDGKGMFSAARVWWMFRVFGHDKVWVLDGGLPEWRSSGFDVESSASNDAILKAQTANEAVKKVYQGQVVNPLTFEAKFQPHLVWTLEQIKQNMVAQTHQHVDARSKARFDGAAPEPRPEIRSGHIPKSKCIPFPQMLDSSQKLLPVDELRKRFEQEGISLDRPVVASCGTGVTACILVLGLHRIGKPDASVYVGSWTEWATREPCCNS